MADDLKNKTVKGVSWSFVEQILTRGANFVIGIILARLLTPTDYGLVGMISVFIAVSQIFIDGGLTTALIREKDASDADFSTAYFVNFTLSVVFYFILFFSAPIIADFYEQPLLKPLLRVVSLTLVISALSSVHNTLLSKRVDFKSKTIISIATSLRRSWYFLRGKRIRSLGFGRPIHRRSKYCYGPHHHLCPLVPETLFLQRLVQTAIRFQFQDFGSLSHPHDIR